jgi:serine-type D-Ala-D-Ala carboxypeptidase/endopeptidase (penicillin-binding protein 4)
MKALLNVLIALQVSLLGCAGFAGVSSQTDHIEHFRRSLDAVFADSAFQATCGSLIVGSLESGEVLYDRNSALLVRPASNMKLLTSAAALHYLGKNFSFNTVLYGDSLPQAGNLSGNLYVKGFGNPDLTTADLDSLVGQLRARGITQIAGDVIVDVSYFGDDYWGAGWMWDDEPEPDEAFITALSVNDNCVKVTVMPGPEVGSLAIVTLEPQTSYVTISSAATTAPDTVRRTLKIDRLYRERSNTICVTGMIPARRRAITQKITVWKPELYAGTLLKERLESDSIQVAGSVKTGTVSPGAAELARHAWPLDSMLVNLNKTSDNLSAECTLRAIAAELTGNPGTADAGVSKVYEFLSMLEIDTTRINMVDGSGVSHYNLLTTRTIYTLLQAMGRRPDLFPAYYASLPVAGADGTLESRMRGSPANGVLRAKTGTLSAVTSLSGYVRTYDGETLVFSMSMQNYLGSGTRYKQIEDRVGSLLAGFSRTNPFVPAP